jgi:hypothetical protein
MAALPTSSFRAPAEHHALVHAVAKALTRRPDIAEPLRALLASAADTGTATPAEPLPDLHALVRRLDAVERQVADHGALLATRDALQGEKPKAGAIQALPNALQAEEPAPPGGLLLGGTASTAPAEPWTVGEGRTKRLTPAGLAELDRRLQAGEAAAGIAEALVVSAQTVSKRRAALAGGA